MRSTEDKHLIARLKHLEKDAHMVRKSVGWPSTYSFLLRGELRLHVCFALPRRSRHFSTCANGRSLSRWP
jgi:hypothetical protein